MKLIGLAAVVSVALVAGCAAKMDKTRISCTNADVLLTQAQLDELLLKSGADAKMICAEADKIDASAFTDPTKVEVIMPSGQTYSLELQARAG